MHEAARLLLVADRPFALALRDQIEGLEIEPDRIDTPGTLVAALRENRHEVAVFQPNLAHLRLEVAVALAREFGGGLALLVADSDAGAVTQAPNGVRRCAPVNVGKTVGEILLERRRERDRQSALLPEEHCLAALDSAPWVVYAHDAAGRFTYVNRTAERVGGYAPGELLGRNFGDVVAVDQLELARRGRSEDDDPELAMVYEIDLIAREGRRVRVEVMSWLILRNGVPRGVYGTARFLDPADAAIAQTGASIPRREDLRTGQDSTP